MSENAFIQAVRPSAQRGNSASDGGGRWIIRIAESTLSEPRLRLFCFPYAGGGSSMFRHWANAMPPGVELCAVQLPGRENRWTETLLTDFDQVLEEVTTAMHPWLSVPFVVFGHSMGALIAFEVARHLQRQGESPLHLFASGSRAPHLNETQPPMGHLPDAAFLSSLQRLQGIPEEVWRHESLLRALLPVLRADVSLCENYRYQPGEPLTCSLSVYGGHLDNRVAAWQLWAWQHQTQNTFRCHSFPGSHFFIASARGHFLSVLRSELSEILLGLEVMRAV